MPHHTNGEGGFNGISALTIGWMSYRSHAQCVNRVRGLCVELLGIQGTRVIPYCHLKTTTTPVAWGIPCGSLCWDGIGHTHGAHAGCARGRHTRDWICTVAYHQSRDLQVSVRSLRWLCPTERSSPAAAQSLKPVRMSCEDNGIRMGVEAASVEGSEAHVLLILKDLGYRIEAAHCNFKG